MTHTHKALRLQGFTLAELLAVVIIIGLLSSIAVGYYKKSVEQSRFTEGLTVAATLSEAMNRAYTDQQMEGVISPSKSYKFANLDVQIANKQACTPASDTCLKTKHFQLQTDSNGVLSAYRGTPSSYKYYIEVWPAYHASNPDRVACVGDTTNGQPFCESMGYTSCSASGTTATCLKP